MRQMIKRAAAYCLAVCMMLALVPAAPAQALSSQEIVTKKMSSSDFKKVSKSSKSNSVLHICSSGKYTAIVKGKPAENEYDIDHMKKLYICSGKKEKVINLEKRITEKYDVSEESVIEFYQLTCINKKFYITGCVGTDMDIWQGKGTHFLLSTTSGSKVTIKTIKKQITTPWSCSEYPGWELHYVKDQYVAIPRCNAGVHNDKKEEYVYTYYTSSDLSSWKAVAMKASSYSKKLAAKKGGILNMHFALATPDALYYIEEINGGANADYQYVWTCHYMYTTDHKNFKELKNLNNVIKTDNNKCSYNDDIYEDYTRSVSMIPFGDGYPVLELDNQHADKNGNYTATNLKLFTSQNTTDFESAIKIDKAWDYVYAWGTDDSKYLQTLVNTADGNYFCRVNGETGKGTKYTTTLDAKKVHGEGSKKGYSYAVYDGKYLLVTKNGGAKTFKIKTGKSKLSGVGIAGDYLVLAGSKGKDYYVKISTVNAACK